jgi:hypothetical protein
LHGLLKRPSDERFRAVAQLNAELAALETELRAQWEADAPRRVEEKRAAQRAAQQAGRQKKKAIENAWREADTRGRALLAKDPRPVFDQASQVGAYNCAVSAWMERDLKRRMNPLTATFEEYPSSTYWEGYMSSRRGQTGAKNADYLNGTLWFDIIRPRILKRDSWRCFRCNHRDASHVHHASYHPFVMVGLADEWLYTLCRPCHDAVHERKLNPDNLTMWTRLHDWRGPMNHRKRRMPYSTHLPTTDQCVRWDLLLHDQIEHLMFAKSLTLWGSVEASETSEAATRPSMKPSKEKTP